METFGVHAHLSLKRQRTLIITLSISNICPGWWVSISTPDANRQLSLWQRRSVSMATWRSKGSALIQWTTINRYCCRHTPAGRYCLSCHYLARWKSLLLCLLGLTFSTHPSLTQWPLSVTPALVIASRALALLRRIGLWIQHRGAGAITKI